MIRKVTLSLVFTSFFILGLNAVSDAQVANPGQTDGRTGENIINTAVPFLRISPDARSGAMGDAGIALSPDVNATYWNLSKLPFAEENTSVGLTYTPWLRELTNDVFLASLNGYTKLDDNQAIGATLRYFSLGNIQFTDWNGTPNGDFHPREYAFDLGYARKLGEEWSIGLAGRYIYSNLANGQTLGGTAIRAGRAVAADVSFFHTKTYDNDNGSQNVWNIGATITNIGTKISYTSSAQYKDFLPTNLGIGTAYTFGLDEFNKITLTLDVNKLMVPTPDSSGDYRNKGVVAGMFSSFGDAPGGFKEELHELMYSGGAEYWYNNTFAVRAGYYSEYKTKGDRKYFTAGVGLKYDIIGASFSYLVPSGNGTQRNPLSNTLRLTLTVNLSRDNGN